MSQALGRGLGSLIPTKNNKQEDSEKNASQNPVKLQEKTVSSAMEIEIDKIITNSKQPRTCFNDNQLNELADSIREYGVIQPVVVSKLGDKYELIAGERRLRASKIAGLKKIPAVLRQTEDKDKLAIALIENIQRQDLNPIETALAYHQLIDEFNYTQEELAKNVGKSRPVIANSLRLLKLPDQIKEALKNGLISEGHGIVLSGLDSLEKQMILFRRITGGGLTFSDTLEESKRMGGTKQAKIRINLRDEERQNMLKNYFGARTEIKRKRKGGQILINFTDDEELERIINLAR